MKNTKNKLQEILEDAPEEIKESWIEKNVSAGMPILVQNDEYKFLYILISGTASVSILLSRGTVMPLFVNEPWSILGEMEIFCKIKNIATVTAITDCRLLLINQNNLLKWIRERPDFAVTMLDEISTKAVYITQKVIRLSSMTVDERVLDCLLSADEEGRLDKVDKQYLCLQCCAPLRSINRSVAHWKSKGVVEYEKKRFCIPDRDKAHKMIY